MASDGTRLAEAWVSLARDTVDLQRGVETECELKHCVDKEGRELRPGVTGRREVGVKGVAGLPISIISCPRTARSKEGPRCRLQTDPFWNGMIMSRKRLLVEDAGVER
jgi:hypothetical protein